MVKRVIPIWDDLRSTAIMVQFADNSTDNTLVMVAPPIGKFSPLSLDCLLEKKQSLDFCVGGVRLPKQPLGTFVKSKEPLTELQSTGTQRCKRLLKLLLVMRMLRPVGRRVYDATGTPFSHLVVHKALFFFLINSTSLVALGFNLFGWDRSVVRAQTLCPVSGRNAPTFN